MPDQRKIAVPVEGVIPPGQSAVLRVSVPLPFEPAALIVPLEVAKLLVVVDVRLAPDGEVATSIAGEQRANETSLTVALYPLGRSDVGELEVVVSNAADEPTGFHGSLLGAFDADEETVEPSAIHPGELVYPPSDTCGAVHEKTGEICSRLGPHLGTRHNSGNIDWP